MKTTTRKPKHYRYQNVIHRHHQVAHQLMDLTGMTPDEYYAREFEGGLQLLNSYFNDGPGATYLKKLLAEDKRYQYWAHYRLGRRQYEVQFWNGYQAIYEQEREYLTEQEQLRELRSEWKLEMRAYNELQATHERLRQHIIQCQIPTPI